jgi:hypothetical protein
MFSCKYKEDVNGHPGFDVCDSWVYFRSMELLGIRPLRLVPKEPVTFEGVIKNYYDGGKWHRLLELPSQEGFKDGQRFRCVEIVEEEA